MLGRLWPRFALEACFLAGVAVAAGLLHLATAAIVAVMVVAYLATVLVEWSASRAKVTTEPVGDVEPGPARADGVGAVRTSDPLTAEDSPAEVAAEPEPEPEPEPEQPQPVPTSEPQPAEPQPEPHSELTLVPAPTQLVAVAAPPEPEPEPAPVAPAEPDPAPLATLPLPAYPQEWNVWEIERLARERSGADPIRDEEWGFLLVYLREFASPDGLLPTDFDALVRESFGELVAGRAR